MRLNTAHPCVSYFVIGTKKHRNGYIPVKNIGIKDNKNDT